MLALTGIASCTTPPLQPGVTIARDLRMVLPLPSELGRNLRLVQLVTARYGDRVVTFEGHIDATDGRFTLAVLDPLGRRALGVAWTDTDLVTETAPWFPAELRPQNMLADLVLIYWPPDVLRRALGPSHAVFEVAPDHRAVRRDGAELIRANVAPATGGDPAGARVQYHNLDFGYSLDIRTLEQAP